MQLRAVTGAPIRRWDGRERRTTHLWFKVGPLRERHVDGARVRRPHLRLTRTVSTRESPAATLEGLGCSYVPVGNILEKADEAQQPLFFDNLLTTAGAQYEYEASYRLAWALGREHAGTGGVTRTHDEQATSCCYADKQSGQTGEKRQ